MPTLFILEDNEIALRTLRRRIDSRWAVESASSRSEALRLLGSARSWSGFLLDVGLGEDAYGGIGVLQTVRQWWPLVPAALVTGTLEPLVINQAAALGATMIAKPPGPNDLKLFMRHVQECALVAERAERLADDACNQYRLTASERQLVWWMACGNSAVTFRPSLRGSPQVGARPVDAAVASILAKAQVASTEALLIQLECQTPRRAVGSPRTSIGCP